MEHIIQFRGLHLDRSEDLAELGELAFCEGAEIKNGVLRPTVIKGTPVGSLIYDGKVCELLYLHETFAYTHYLARTPGGKLVSFDAKDPDSVLLIDTPDNIDVPSLDVSSITSLNDTLVINDTNSGLHYFYWSRKDGEDVMIYYYLGQRPPVLNFEFTPSVAQSSQEANLTVSCSIVDSDDTTAKDQSSNVAIMHLPTLPVNSASFVPDPSNDIYVFVPRAVHVLYWQQVKDMFWSLINSTNTHIAKNGRFYAPFFVRYAYRMYDGSLINQSVPVFVAADFNEIPQVFCCNAAYEGDKWHMENDFKYPLDGARYAKGSGFALAYKPINVALLYKLAEEQVDQLKKWRDVILSVDIFLTPPITYYNTDAPINAITNSYLTHLDSLQAFGNNTLFAPVINQSGTVFADVQNFFNYYVSFQSQGIKIPRKYPSDKKSRFDNISTFYKALSIDIEKLEPAASWAPMKFERNTLDTLTTRELMKDGYRPYSKLIPSGHYTYNHRLNLFGVREQLFEGFPIENLIQRAAWKIGDDPECYNIVINRVSVKIKTSSGYRWINSSSDTPIAVYAPMLKSAPICSADERAVLMQLQVVELQVIEDVTIPTIKEYVQLQMHEHNELNIAITDPSSFAIVNKDETYETDNVVPNTNTIYTSEANNPFIFPPEGVNPVGTGTVLGLASTTKALSQGQFGQFPLMAFATDGIWALNVAENGLYTSVVPISREVVQHTSSGAQARSRSIAQLNQAVFFATDRALNILSESDVTSVSDSLQGVSFDIELLSRQIRNLESLQGRCPGMQFASRQLSDMPVINGDMDVVPLYDYCNRRVLILPADFSRHQNSPCLIFSGTDSAFSTFHFPKGVKAILNSYPYPYIEYADGVLERLDRQYDYADDGEHPALLVTRAMTFGTFSSVIKSLRHSTTGTVPMISIFGSNDGCLYRYVGTTDRVHADYLPGYPFRYWRMMIAFNMTAKDQYTALHVGATPIYDKM